MNALIFDHGGVAANPEKAHYHSWQALADEEGIRFDRTAGVARRGLPREQSLDVLLGLCPLPSP